MQTQEHTVTVDDGTPLYVCHFAPDAAVPVRGVVHVAHGLAEHGVRYARFAEALTAAGYHVYANDHRGHGKTAQRDEDLGLFAEHGGWRRGIDDLIFHVRRECGAHPGLPVVIFGHSMGSFMVQQLIAEHGELFTAAILCGSNGRPDALATAGRAIARVERARLGPRGRSRLLNSLSFDGFNKPFRPNRTAFDWLSRDPAEVDRYVADPRCGFIATNSLFVDLVDALPELSRPALQARIPKNLPVFIVAGAEDPVSRRTAGLQQLLRAYRVAGLTNVSHRFYPGARHEILNETNRDEVTRDIVAWIEANTPKPT